MRLPRYKFSISFSLTLLFGVLVGCSGNKIDQSMLDGVWTANTNGNHTVLTISNGTFNESILTDEEISNVSDKLEIIDNKSFVLGGDTLYFQLDTRDSILYLYSTLHDFQSQIPGEVYRRN